MQVVASSPVERLPFATRRGRVQGGAREREGAMLAHLVLLLALAAVLRLVVLAMRWRWRVIVCANLKRKQRVSKSWGWFAGG